MTEYIRQVDDPHLSTKRPQHVYESTAPCPLYGDACDRSVTCQLTTNINESVIWCNECAEQHEWTQLKKSFQAMGTNFARVWHDTGIPNITTGRVESDPKKFATHLRDESRRAEERLGMPVNYEPVDLTDKDALGVTEEGMDATHDRAVKDGRKDSRGRFVW